MAPLLSLIVPVRADELAAERLLAQVPPDPRLELILVDGGGNAGLNTRCRDLGHVVYLCSPPGRAIQMNRGAGVARGDWLLFLHADSSLPAGWLDTFAAAVTPSMPDGSQRLHRAPPAVGGWFRFALDAGGWQARMIERGVAARVRWLRLPYGDQGIFVRRSVFERLGGFREMPLMEDVEFVRRLTRAGRAIELPLVLVTSARRWRQDGWVRRSARNMTLVALYFAGVPPRMLARWYSRHGG